MATALTPWERLQERLPGGFRARHVALGTDEETISSLINANARAIGYPLLTSIEDMRDELTEASTDLQNDLVLVEDADGNAVAWAQAWLSSDSAPGAFLIGTVHPAHQGIGLGRAIFTWSRERARVLLTDHPTGAMFVHLPDCDAPARRLVESQGGTPIRFYSDMLLRFSDRPIAENLEHLSAPAGYEVLPMDRVDGELLRQLRNHCFADHWGSWEMSPESWRDLLREDSARPSCSEVVIDRHGALVAMQMTSEFPQDAATVGRVRWVGQLGVHRDHRRRGLASLLIERHLVTTKRDGLEGSMLGVDAASLTGANTLYESLGYRKTGGGVRYELPPVVR